MSTFPKWSYAIATVIGGAESGEAIENGGAHLQLGDLTVEIARHHALAGQLETAHLGFHQTASMVASPFLPNSTTRASHGLRYRVARRSPRATVLPRLARWRRPAPPARRSAE
jgi:hypothetical protein